VVGACKVTVLGVDALASLRTELRCETLVVAVKVPAPMLDAVMLLAENEPEESRFTIVLLVALLVAAFAKSSAE
jgi:hypothetical protein